MRTSSIKSRISTIILVATLTLAVPIAEARSAREPRTGRSDAIVRLVLNLLKRIGRVTVTGGPSIPTSPATGNGNDTTSGTGTTTGKTGQ